MAKKLSDIPALDYTSKLKPGVKGEISVNAGIYKGKYASRVEDVRGDIVGLAHPLMKGALLPAYRDLNFTFTMEDSGALYVFNMSVRRVETQSGIPVMWANLHGYPKRIQRRQFLRVPCLWNIMIYHLDYETSNPMSAEWISARAIDVSIGGYRFRVTDEAAKGLYFETGDRVLIKFVLADKEYIQVGRTSRIVHDKSSWEIGVGFESLPVSVEKRLFEYIRQQEIMSREQK